MNQSKIKCTPSTCHKNLTWKLQRTFLSPRLLPGPTTSARFSRTSLFIYPLLNFPHLHPLQAEPPQAATPADRDSPRLCKGAFGLQKLCEIPDGAEGVRMHGSQLIFGSRQGPAKELLCLQGGLWMDDSRVASYAVARWALCCDPQLVKGNALLVQCGTLIVQTPKPANLRIWSA